MVNKCCMSNVKNAISKQNCNINLNYRQPDLQQYVKNVIHIYWQIIEYKRNKLMNHVLKELYQNIGMKISDLLFIYISISDT